LRSLDSLLHAFGKAVEIHWTPLDKSRISHLAEEWQIL
jgi:hypothetical protein